jgi:hypothetical protein
VQQYKAFGESKDYQLIFRFELVQNACLYNRQALALGLISTMRDSTGPFATKYRNRYKSQRLTRFDARITPFDRSFRLGLVPVDYPDKPLDMRYLGEVSDKELNEIIAVTAQQ